MKIICRLHSRAFIGVYLPTCILLHLSSLWVLTSGYSKRYWARPGVGVLARSWCNSQKNEVGFEQMLKLLMHLFLFLMVNIFSWGMAGHSIITLSNDQNSSLVRTCSILVALFHPSNVQNFTSTSPPTSSN